MLELSSNANQGRPSHITVLRCCPCRAGDEERVKMVMVQRVVGGLCWPMLGCQLSRKSHARLPSSSLEHVLISTGAIPRCVWVFFLCFFGLFNQSHDNSGFPRTPAPSYPWLPSARAIGMRHHLCFEIPVSRVVNLETFSCLLTALQSPKSVIDSGLWNNSGPCHPGVLFA